MKTATTVMTLMVLATAVAASAQAEKQLQELPPPAQTAVAAARLVHEGKLSAGQRLYRDWSDEYFRDVVNPARWQGLSATEKAAAEELALKQLSSSDAQQRYETITALAALGSKKAVPDLLKIAMATSEDGRARWMAARALGLVGDVRAVPDLVHLTYHYSANTRSWAQISLVRLTGQDFGRDVEAWKAWWEKQGGEPAISTQPIIWTTKAELADPQKQIESDRRFLENLPKQRNPANTVGSKRGSGKPEDTDKTAPAGVVCDPVTGVCLPPVPESASSSSTASRKKGSLEVSNTEAAPLEFSLADAYGREIRASDYRGAPVLILLGACWCGGCQQDAEVLRGVEQKYRARGLQTIRCTVWDNELPAWEFQKHYRLPSVPLQDPIRQFERRYNRDGWTFLMLADAEGRVVYRANSPVDWTKVEKQIEGQLSHHGPLKTIVRDGISYLPAVLERSGETLKARQRDVYPSLACAADGRVYVALTSNRNGTQDIFLRVFDGQKWSSDQPVAATDADEFDGTVIVDRDNRPWVSWTSNVQGPRYDVFVTCPSRSSSVLDPLPVTNSDDDAMQARMAVDSQDRLWVTYYKWAKLSGRSRDKEAFVCYRQGEGWSKEIHVSPEDIPDYEDHTDPILAAQGDGVVCAWSWDFHRPKNYSPIPEMPTIFLRRVGPTGTLGRVRAVSGPSSDTRPTLTVAPDGRVWCAWESAGGRNTMEKQIAFSIEDLDLAEHPGAGVNVTGMRQNLCTPCLAMSPRGNAALVWAEVSAQGRWTLKQTAWDAKSNAWLSPRTLVAEGNPRFPSAAYAPDGVLWVAYSVEKGNRREIEVLAGATASGGRGAASERGKPQ